MKNTMEISKEDFIKRFANPMVENMKKNLSPELADSCKAEVKIKGKTGKNVDFKSIVIEIDIPDGV